MRRPVRGVLAAALLLLSACGGNADPPGTHAVGVDPAGPLVLADPRGAIPAEVRAGQSPEQVAAGWLRAAGFTH